jgi:hypothetical protein
MSSFLDNLKKADITLIEHYLWNNQKQFNHLLKKEKGFENRVKNVLETKIKDTGINIIKQNVDNPTSYYDHYAFREIEEKILDYVVGNKMVEKNLLSKIKFDHGESIKKIEERYIHNLPEVFFNYLLTPTKLPKKKEFSTDFTPCCYDH